ncbi:hypothetical protein ACFY04_42155 [Streptomyces sp. NPDC001549]|uniref:hypothetical protein n=1 Tax=Streptomyces sp. NPDC001549 TaxID=3364586 RepID=UPI0036944EBB
MKPEPATPTPTAPTRPPRPGPPGPPGPQQRVLEAGTGAGCNAGLLATRIGAGPVTSVEVDAELAAAADDGKSATGWVQGLGMFMPSRSIDQGRKHHAIRGDCPPDRAVHVERGPRALSDVNLVFALRVSHPDIRISTKDTKEGPTVWLHDGVSSWATTIGQTGTTAAAYEGGPRQLLAEADARAAALGGAWLTGAVGLRNDRHSGGQRVWSGTADAGPYTP